MHEIELEFGVLDFVKKGKPENPEKTFGASTKINNTETQSTYDAESDRESNPGHSSPPTLMTALFPSLNFVRVGMANVYKRCLT